MLVTSWADRSVYGSDIIEVYSQVIAWSMKIEKEESRNDRGESSG